MIAIYAFLRPRGISSPMPVLGKALASDGQAKEAASFSPTDQVVSHFPYQGGHCIPPAVWFSSFLFVVAMRAIFTATVI